MSECFCFDDTKLDDYITLNCNHVFHRSCLLDYADHILLNNTKNTICCPMCRRDIISIKNEPVLNKILLHIYLNIKDNYEYVFTNLYIITITNNFIFTTYFFHYHWWLILRCFEGIKKCFHFRQSRNFNLKTTIIMTRMN